MGWFFRIPIVSAMLIKMTLSPSKFRLLGVLPLLFFILQGVHYWRINELGHMLWMCNIGNLILALGIFLIRPTWIRVASIWTVPGLVVWFVYVVLPWGVFLTSTLAHVGGLVVALIALKQVGMDRRAWLYSFVWYLFIQLMSRLLTSPALNVNVAHRVQDGWQHTFTSYLQFLLTVNVMTAVILWLLGLMLWKIWPASDARTTEQQTVVV